MSFKVLLIGQGGREVALAKQISKEAEIYAYMDYKNPDLVGMSKKKKKNKIGSLSDNEKIKNFAVKNSIDLVMIGSELPLAGGIVDYLETYDFKCFGPSKHIAKLEWDKSFCRYFLNKVNPSLNPNFWIFKEEKRLESFLKKYKQQVVVKPIGLTGGKGVRAVGIQLKDNNDALKYGKRILKKKIGGSPRVIIEERRYGKHQFSFLKSSNLIQNKLDAVIIIKNF